LPLRQQLPSIWDFLYRLLDGAISEQQWDNFKQDILGSPLWHAQIYHMRTENPFHWGPYAILVRDLAFKPEDVHNHDYFSGPEIIEDICYCFRQIYHLDVLKLFLQKTKPCIVKFIDGGTGTKYVRAALWHLHKIAWREKCTDYCNDCFDGRGVPVARDRILGIEFPNRSDNR